MGPCLSICSCSSEVFHPEVGLGGPSLFPKLDIHSAVFGAKSVYSTGPNPRHCCQ